MYRGEVVSAKVSQKLDLYTVTSPQPRMRIGVDMGSDHMQVVPVRVLAAKELPDGVRLVLIGDETAIQEGLRAEQANPPASISCPAGTTSP